MLNIKIDDKEYDIATFSDEAQGAAREPPVRGR